MDHKEFSSRGGLKTAKTHPKSWYRDNQRKSVEARKARKELLETEAKLVK